MVICNRICDEMIKSSCSFLVSLAILAIILWENIWLKKFYTFFLLSKYKSSILRYKYYFLITLFIYWKEIIKTIVQLNLYLIVSKLHSEWWLRSFSFKFYGKRFFVKIVSAQIFAYAATKRFMTKDKWTLSFSTDQGIFTKTINPCFKETQVISGQ